MMTDAERESQAKRRFFTLVGVRFFGAVLVMVGFVIIGGKWDPTGAELNKFVGAGLVLIGAFDFAVVPLLLARRWKRQARR